MIISYAQNREDIYINWLLEGKEQGFYVDIGASDPVHYSVTNFFYQKGWRGINVEPISRYSALLNSQRPRDINLMLGVAREPGFLDFREYPDADGLSSFSKEIQNQYYYSKIKFIDYQVNVLPLVDILREHLPKDQIIDFMKIDVEGYEYEVIVSNDWEVFKPKLLIIEVNHIIDDWHILLEAKKYRKVFFDGINEYFMPEHSIRKELYQDFPKFVIAPNSINYSHYLDSKNITLKLEEQIAESQSVIRKLEEQIAESQKIVIKLEEQIAEPQSVIRKLEEQIAELQSSIRRPWSSRVKIFLKELFLRVMKNIKYHLGIAPSHRRYRDTIKLSTALISDDPQIVLHLLKRADVENYLEPQERGLGYPIYRLINFSFKKLQSFFKLVLKLLRSIKKRLAR